MQVSVGISGRHRGPCADLILLVGVGKGPCGRVNVANGVGAVSRTDCGYPQVLDRMWLTTGVDSGARSFLEAPLSYIVLLAPLDAGFT
jgi:hypothetical protein